MSRDLRACLFLGLVVLGLAGICLGTAYLLALSVRHTAPDLPMRKGRSYVTQRPLVLGPLPLSDREELAISEGAHFELLGWLSSKRDLSSGRAVVRIPTRYLTGYRGQRDTLDGAVHIVNVDADLRREAIEAEQPPRDPADEASDGTERPSKPR